MNVTLSKISNIFTLTDNKKLSKNNKFIYVNNILDLKIFILILKNNVSVNMSSVGNISHLKYKYLSRYTNVALLNDNRILRCFEKIRPEFGKFGIVTTINKALVHKRDKKNILLKKQIKYSNSNVISYEAQLNLTPEFHLDHIHNDHVEATIISEACRQAAMATALTNLHSDRQFLICKELKNYYKLVRRNEPVIINVTELNKSQRLGSCYFTLFQDGELCTSGYFIGYIR